MVPVETTVLCGQSFPRHGKSLGWWKLKGPTACGRGGGRSTIRSKDAVLSTELHLVYQLRVGTA